MYFVDSMWTGQFRLLTKLCSQEQGVSLKNSFSWNNGSVSSYTIKVLSYWVDWIRYALEFISLRRIFHLRSEKNAWERRPIDCSRFLSKLYSTPSILIDLNSTFTVLTGWILNSGNFTSCSKRNPNSFTVFILVINFSNFCTRA